MLGMRFLAALLCSTVLLAQAKSDPLRYVPKHADVVARTVGPAAWQRAFAPTSLGKALADPQLLPIWVKLLAFLQTTVFEGEQQLEQANQFWDALEGYSGEVVFAARADWDAMDDLDKMAGAAVVAMGADGKTDLNKLAELLGDKLPGEMAGEVEVGGVAATLRELGTLQILGPVMHEKHLVLLFGQDLERRAAWFFNDAADKEATSELRQPVFALSLHLKRAIDKLVKSGAQDASMPSWVLEPFGVLALDELTFSMSPDGTYVGQEMHLKFNEGFRGLLSVFCPVRATKPDLLRLLPASASTYAVAPMDMSALVKVYEEVFADHADDLPMDRESLESVFTDMTDLDLLKDVVAHIGGEYMRIDDMAAQLAYDEDESEQLEEAREKLSEACFVIKLKNGRVFGSNLDTAIRSRGLHVSRKREEYNKTNIYRMNLLGMFPIEYAVTDSLFVLGIGKGEGTKKNLRGVLDAAAAGTGDAEPALAPEVVQRLKGMHAGWGGIQVGSLVEILEGLIATGETLDELLADGGMTLEDLEDPWQLMMDASKALKSVLARHKAGVIVNLDYFEKDRYVMRSRW
tara:strand:+ start:1009 stop:2733 length:1725 start_codon:yes stop_codon:yes gene_type:complete